MLQTHHLLLSSTFHLSFSHHPEKLNFLHKPTISLSAFRRQRSIIEPWLVQAQEPITTAAPKSSAAPAEGPVEVTQSIFATTDDPSPVQVATSDLLTGAIGVFLFRALRPRAKRAKELALLAAITAGVIALVLYKFTTTIEAALNCQAVSDNFSVRQITITIRTIVNGLSYLAH